MPGTTWTSSGKKWTSAGSLWSGAGGSSGGSSSSVLAPVAGPTYPSTPLPTYRVVVTDRWGAIREEIPVKDLQYTFSLNDAGSVSFSMPQYHPKATYDLMTPGARNILIYRNDDLIWGGRLWTASTDAETSNINFGGNGWFSLLLKRYINVTQTFKSVDEFTIAWNLIALANSQDDLRIQRFSTAVSGKARTRTYYDYERKNIGEALQELSSLDGGFDFEITPDLYWKTYYPSKGTSPDNIEFESGKNIRGYSVQYDATNIENEITGIGAGDGAQALRVVKSDATSKATYGLMQGVRSWTDVVRQTTLGDHTQEELRVSKDILIQPEFSVVTNDPPFGSYAVGDTVGVTIDDGYNQLSAGFRITTITVSVADSGFEAVGLFFDSQIVE